MDNRDTIKRILSYLNLQMGIPLSKLKNQPIKTKKQFLDNYNKHDKATKSIALTYFQRDYSLHPIGKDLRHQNVFLSKEVPDYYVEKLIDSQSKISFCFDVKSKSKKDYYGWVNEKSIKDYKEFSQNCKVNVFLIFLLIDGNTTIREFAYSNIYNRIIDHHIEWDGNKVLTLDYEQGLPSLKKNPNELAL